MSNLITNHKNRVSAVVLTRFLFYSFTPIRDIKKITLHSVGIIDDKAAELVGYIFLFPKLTTFTKRKLKVTRQNYVYFMNFYGLCGKMFVYFVTVL